MDLRIPERKFVCIDYPAIVQNHEVMLQTLGGPSAVTKVTVSLKTDRTPCGQLITTAHARLSVINGQRSSICLLYTSDAADE